VTRELSASRHFARLYTAATVPIAVIAFDFDPLVHIGSSLTVRWQTLALALVVFVCLSTMGTLARRARLRADDLVYIAIGAAPERSSPVGSAMRSSFPRRSPSARRR